MSVIVGDDQTGTTLPGTLHPVLTDLNNSGQDIQVMRLDVGSGTSESRVTSANPLPVTVSGGIISDIALALGNIFRAISRPIWYTGLTNALRVQTDTNSTVLTYQYLVYPYSGYGPGTTVWGQSITDGLNMARTSWAVNVRGRIS